MTTSSKSQRPRKQTQGQSPCPTEPAIVATFDRTAPEERFICDRIQHMHSGRRPLLRAHAMRRIGDKVYELACWHPGRAPRRVPAPTVLIWDIGKHGLSWQDFPTIGEARTSYLARVETALSGATTPPDGQTGDGSH